MIPWWHWPVGIILFYIWTGLFWWLIGIRKMYMVNGWEIVRKRLHLFLKLGPLAFLLLIFMDKEEK